MQLRLFKQSNRTSNIELLRILCIIGVIVGHFCNAIPNAFDMTSGGNYLCLRVIYSVAIIAVNVFMLITGYFSVDNTSVRVSKVFDLLVEVLFYKLLFFTVESIFSRTFIITHFIWALIPTGYFVLIYLSVYLISPWVNRAVANLSKDNYFTLLLISTFLFSVWNSCFNILGDIIHNEMHNQFTVAQFTTDRGYTIVIFLLMYMWGGYIRRFGLFNKNVCISIFLICTFITSLGKYFFPQMSSLLYYDSFFIVLQSLATFSLFSQIKIQSNFINFCAKYTFGVYLCHTFFLHLVTKILPLQKMLTSDVWLMLLALIIVVFIAYWGSVLVDIIRSSLWNHLAKFYSNNKYYRLIIGIE